MIRKKLSDDNSLKEEINSKQELRKNIYSKYTAAVDSKKNYHENEISKINEFIELILKNGNSNEIQNQSIENCLNESINHLAQQIKNYSRYTISCSASFFLDETMKTASNILLENKAGDANMEDDLVINLIKYIKLHIDEFNKNNNKSIKLVSKCLRVNCDPYNISKDFKDKFKEWTKETRYSLDSYVDAILWKASGFNEHFLLKTAHWSVADKFIANKDPKMFFQTNIINANNKNIVVDPFWREIATDFLADLRKINEFKNDVDEILKKLNPWIIGNSVLCSEKVNKIKEMIKKLLEKNDLLIAKPRDSNNYKEDEYKIWIRQKSWGG